MAILMWPVLQEMFFYLYAMMYTMIVTELYNHNNRSSVLTFYVLALFL